MSSVASLARALVLFTMIAGCAHGAPPGFSAGSSWSFPLVGALEGGALVTPVFINDKGPYLFLIDPDALLSSVDDAIVSENQLYSQLGAQYVDESDKRRQSRLAEVKTLRVGNLSVRNLNVFIHKVGTFAAAGRQIRGVLGRDVIADSLVFGFDRDRGVAYLATQEGFVVPAGSQAIAYDTARCRLPDNPRPPPRRILKASIDGTARTMHLDLGAVESQLRPNLWGALQQVPSKHVVIDEAGTRRTTESSAIAGQVTIGNVAASSVELLAYDDRRWDAEELDGSLGLGFFERYAVWANWDQHRYYLVPRGDAAATSAERLGRWGSAAIAKCTAPGCATVSLIPSDAAAAGDASAAAGATGTAGGAVTPPPATDRRAGAVVRLERDPAAAGLDLEVLIEAVDNSGHRAGLPRLVAMLPAGVDAVTQGVDPSYNPYQLRVVDISPFVRKCPRSGGCVFQLAK